MAELGSSPCSLSTLLCGLPSAERHTKRRQENCQQEGWGWGCGREAQGREDPRKRESTRRRGSWGPGGVHAGSGCGSRRPLPSGNEAGRLLVATGETRHQKCISHFLSLGLAPTHALLCGRHTLIQISSQLSLLPFGLAVSFPLQTPQPQTAVSVFSAGKSE